MDDVTNSRLKLDLNRDLAFLLQNVTDDAERASILQDLQVLKTNSDLEFASFEELEDVLLSPFWGSTWGNYSSGRFVDRPLLERAKLFFEKVEDVYSYNGDVTYATPDGGAGASNTTSESSYVFVNYIEHSDSIINNLPTTSATFFGALEKSATIIAVPDASLSGFAKDFTPEEQHQILTILSEAQSQDESQSTHRLLSICRSLAELKHKYVVSDDYFFQGLKDFASLESTEILEAMRWYCSFEMSWMDGLGNLKNLTGPVYEKLNDDQKQKLISKNRQDKVDIIKESFDPALVVTRRAKFVKFYPVELKGQKKETFDAKQKKFDGYRTLAKNVSTNLEVLSQMYSVTLTPERVADIVTLFILIESNADSNAENGSFYGLMQAHKDRFKEFFGKPLSASEMKNPKTNITVGTDYFLSHCFQKDEDRNPEEVLSLAMTNYNWGAGAAINYRKGKTLLEKDSQPYNYLRDLIIYERLKKETGLDRYTIFESY